MPTFNYGLAPGAIIITGAASGIGRATAMEAFRQGLDVIAWDLDQSGLADLKTHMEGGGAASARVATSVVDIADSASVKSAMRAATSHFAPSYLVNNAGPAARSELPFGEALAKSLIATHDLTELWLESDPCDPVLVNVCSAAGNVIAGPTDWYSAGKAGLAGYTRSLAGKRPKGLRANAVAPGFIDTPRLTPLFSSEEGRGQVARNPLKRAGRPEEIATLILFLLSPGASYMNGALIVCDGGSSLAF